MDEQSMARDFSAKHGDLMKEFKELENKYGQATAELRQMEVHIANNSQELASNKKLAEGENKRLKDKIDELLSKERGLEQEKLALESSLTQQIREMTTRHEKERSEQK